MEVCKICGMKTAMPERHKVKYARVHELVESEKLDVRAAIQRAEQEREEAGVNGR